ncbi:MAG: energy transducer TonB [Acidobacteriota bacterium]|nr:energy transducer TonB [Acidobacteriota bacterium]
MKEEGEDKSLIGYSGQKPQEPLFQYVLEDRPPVWKTLASGAFWKQLFISLFTSFGGLNFIPSVFADAEELEALRAGGRTRKMEAGVVSIFLHAAFFLAIFFIARGISSVPAIDPDEVVFVNTPIFLPFDIEGDGQEGGGGGGGGKNQPEPPATGELPETTPVQMIAPDPTNPQPLMAADDLLAQVPSVEMPIQLPRNLSLPIGDITGPPNYSTSYGPGSGGGIGTGRGTGIGSGTGAGVGPGSGGGMGGGSGGGIGTGVGKGVTGSIRQPEVLVEVKPEYTEEGRKAKAEGIVILSATIRKDGTVDNVKIVRGLGYGLDESAVRTVSTRWRFRPATRNGVAIDYPANIEVNFALW